MSQGSVITIGTFDGVHLGHQKILKVTRYLALHLQVTSTAITFQKPPRQFFTPVPEPTLLTTVPEKIELLKQKGIQTVHCLQFNSRLASISAEDFLKKFIIQKFKAKEVVVGYDFKFGHGRKGDTHFLKTLGERYSLPIVVVPPLYQSGIPISSGRIRQFLREGKLSKANQFLGYPYFVTGTVLRGNSIGRELGFPTANLNVAPDKILPLGVYVVKVSFLHKKRSKTIFGMCNCGFRPTLPTQKRDRPTLEIHLIHYSEILYGKELKIEFLKLLRDEKKFDNSDQLKEQLNQDKTRTLQFCRKLLS